METALKRSIPDCLTGRVLIQTNESNEDVNRGMCCLVVFPHLRIHTMSYPRPCDDDVSRVTKGGGSCMETALKRSIPDCLTGRVLIQTNESNEEPEFVNRGMCCLVVFPHLRIHTMSYPRPCDGDVSRVTKDSAEPRN
jgi:hypothetical protein